MLQLFYNVLTVCFMHFSVIKGLQNSWERHQEVAEYFHAGLESMGLKLFVKPKVSFKFQHYNFIFYYNLQWNLHRIMVVI